MTAAGEGRDAEHEAVRNLMGAYVLGGLDGTDRAALGTHLAGCAACRDELSRLVPVPGLLRRLPTAPAPDDAPPSVPLEPLLSRVRADRDRERRRLRALVLGVAAATVAAAAAGTALLLTNDPGSGPKPPSAAQPSATAPSVVPPDRTQPLWPGPGVATAGQADLTGKPWGTAITATLADLTGTGPYVLVVVGEGERSEQAATWSATPAGRATVAGATSLPPAQIVAVEVRDVDGRVLASTAG